MSQSDSSEIATLLAAIARAIVRSYYGMAGGDPAGLSDADISPNVGDFQLAHDVLMSPEMQAIKQAFLDDLKGRITWRSYAELAQKERTYLRREHNLPESVIEWVLSDPSTDRPVAQ
jgi:hypothetical protein